MRYQTNVMIGGGIITFLLMAAFSPMLVKMMENGTPPANGATELRTLTFSLGYEHSVSVGRADEYYYSGITYDGGSIQAIITRRYLSSAGSSAIELRIYKGDTVYLDNTPFKLTEIHTNYIVLVEVQ